MEPIGFSNSIIPCSSAFGRSNTFTYSSNLWINGVNYTLRGQESLKSKAKNVLKIVKNFKSSCSENFVILFRYDLL